MANTTLPLRTHRAKGRSAGDPQSNLLPSYTSSEKGKISSCQYALPNYLFHPAPSCNTADTFTHSHEFAIRTHDQKPQQFVLVSKNAPIEDVQSNTADPPSYAAVAGLVPSQNAQPTLPFRWATATPFPPPPSPASSHRKLTPHTKSPPRHPRSASPPTSAPKRTPRLRLSKPSSLAPAWSCRSLSRSS